MSIQPRACFRLSCFYLSLMLRSLHAVWKNSCHSGVDCRRGCRHPHRAHQRVGGHADRNRSGTAIAARRRERPSKWHGPSKAATTVNPQRTRRLRRSTSDCRLPPFATSVRSSAVLHTATSLSPRSRLIRGTTSCQSLLPPLIPPIKVPSRFGPGYILALFFRRGLSDSISLAVAPLEWR